MPVTGTPKFDGIAVAEVSIDFTKPHVVMRAKAAYVDTKSGDTHGWTEGTLWSKETVERARELQEAMEKDLADRDFETSSAAGPEPSRGVGGIGEHVGGIEAPQA